MIRIEIDRATMDRVLRQLGEIQDGASRAMASALNKTASKAKTEASKKIREQVRLKASYVRERLQGPNDNPANKAYFSKLEARISAPRRGLLLSHFTKGGSQDFSQLGKIPKVKVKPKESYQTIGTRPGNVGPSFYIRLKNSGRIGIAQRLASPGPRGGLFDVLHGPSLSQVLTDVKDDIAPNMQTYLIAQLDNEVARILARINAS